MHGNQDDRSEKLFCGNKDTQKCFYLTISCIEAWYGLLRICEMFRVKKKNGEIKEHSLCKKINKQIKE